MKKQLSRDFQLFRAVLEGMSYAEAARANELSPSRVAQLISRTTRHLLHPERLAGDEVPEHDWWAAYEIRAHKEFWERQLTKAGAARVAGSASTSLGEDA